VGIVIDLSAEAKIEQALADLVGYVLGHSLPVRRALLYIEHDYGREVRTLVGDLLVAIDRDRHPSSARELIWGAVASFVGEVERREVKTAG
jgi:hypothetical protein